MHFHVKNDVRQLAASVYVRRHVHKQGYVLYMITKFIFMYDIHTSHTYVHPQIRIIHTHIHIHMHIYKITGSQPLKVTTCAFHARHQAAQCCVWQGIYVNM
jgi:hypothetical protein